MDLKKEDIDNFHNATDYVKNHYSSFDTESLLQFYSYYKQATVGNCDIPQPAWYNMDAVRKWKSWKECYSMSKSKAMQHYIENVNHAINNLQTCKDSSCENTSIKSWAAVSSLSKNEECIPENKTIFDWAKEGNLNKVKELDFDTENRDENGLTILHWAADRGNIDVIDYLITVMNADLNCRDYENQTPLHYASACGYSSIVKYLIEAGANVNVVDKNNLNPEDVAECSSIKELFSVNH